MLEIAVHFQVCFHFSALKGKRYLCSAVANDEFLMPYFLGIH